MKTRLRMPLEAVGAEAETEAAAWSELGVRTEVGLAKSVCEGDEGGEARRGEAFGEVTSEMSTSTGGVWRVGARRRRFGNALAIEGTSPNCSNLAHTKYRERTNSR